MRLAQPAWSRLLPTAAVIALATLGPLGRRLPAPGTWGSLAGLLYFVVFFQRASIGATLLASAVVAYLAVGLCGEAEIRLRKRDPGEVILDEVIVMPLCFLGWRTLPASIPFWAVLAAGFALFRLFDIAKPFGISRLQTLPGGWGVVADDVAAALVACAMLHIGGWIWLRV
ncbi:phosphatidylglycerophosphatase A family protein [Horticoccus sp. 23ND18S-11]|uniref:phosphatidylglycerophosphatase A family protein n=1 Tax=Horticoccus sp. 23ND18S-11 TaxID=3391832 RepID=UPI0039C935EA